jgi:hypothetical protein
MCRKTRANGIPVLPRTTLPEPEKHSEPVTEIEELFKEADELANDESLNELTEKNPTITKGWC